MEIWSLLAGGRPRELADGTHVLGRDRDCAVVLADGTVSRHHALLEVDGVRVSLRDLGSANGTFVNGRRLDGEAELSDGDRVRLGRVRLTLRRGPVAGGAAAGSSRFCPRCGSRLEGQHDTCPHCGDDLIRDRPMSRSEAVAMSEVMPVGEALASPSASRQPTRPAFPVAWDVETGGEGPMDAGDAPGEDTATATLPATATGEEEPAGGAPEPEDAAASSAVAPDGSPGQPGAAPAHPLYQPAAGLPLRTLAMVADGLWLGALAWLVLRLGGDPLAAGVVAATAWLAVSLAGWSQWGTTPGKRLFGLYVCDLDGRPGVGPLRATRRLLGYLLSAAPLGWGFLRVGLSADRRGWHDRLADTYVARIVESAPRSRALP